MKVLPVASPVMIATVFKLLGSPCFSVRVTGDTPSPPFHARSTGWPTVTEEPGNFVRAILSFWAKAATKNQAPIRRALENSILLSTDIMRENWILKVGRRQETDQRA